MVPWLWAACAFAETPSRLTGLHTLRVKECDRVHAVATEIERFGGRVVEHADALGHHSGPRVLGRILKSPRGTIIVWPWLLDLWDWCVPVCGCVTLLVWAKAIPGSGMTWKF